MYYKKLFKNFKNKDFDNVYLFFGKENYIMDQLIKFIQDNLVDKNYKEFNLNIVDYKKNDIKKILNNCDTLPFMSDYTYTIVKNIDLKLSKQEIENLESYISNPNKSNVLIFKVNKKIDKRKKTFKLLKKYATIVDFRKLSKNELRKWVKKYINNKDKNINNRVLDYFLEESGYLFKNSNDNLYNIKQNLDKIINYCKDDVDKKTIDKFIKKPIENNIFKLVDHIFDKKIDKSLDILDKMYKENESLIMILFMIIKQFRVIYKIKLLSDSGISYKKGSKMIKVHSYVAKKAFYQGKKIKYNKLDKILDKSIEIDNAFKTTSADNKILLEKFLIDLSLILYN
ncbi:MAG: DNA polymerase III subunit delta [Bacillota bacterium]